MSKTLIIADLHLHHLPVWHLELCERLVDDILRMGFNEKTTLCLLGDVLEIRDNVDSRCLNLLIKLITHWKYGDVVWTAGQHDSYIPGHATLREMHGIKLENGEVIVIENDVYHHQDSDVWYIPFQRRLEDYRTLLAKIPNNVTVMTHMPTAEVIIAMGAKDVNLVSVKEFARFRKAISGDIHKFCDYPELSYVGAPKQRDWRDSGVIGQFGMYDSTSNEFTRIPTQHPLHIKVDSAADVPQDGNQYIVKTKLGVNIEGDNVIGVTQNTKMDLDTIQLHKTVDVRDMITGYVDSAETTPEGVTKDELKGFGYGLAMQGEAESA